MNPAAQRKAQEELDAVVGGQRLPELSDVEYLHYIRAIVLEGLRWMPVLPLGLPHRLMVDDEYKGHFLPAGTSVFVVRQTTLDQLLRTDGSS